MRAAYRDGFPFLIPCKEQVHLCVVFVLKIRQIHENHGVTHENRLPMVNYEWDYFAENTAHFFDRL